MRGIFRALTLAFCLATGLGSAFPTSAETPDRVALVIGMANYAFIPKLDNTANDARLISEKLAEVGFEVTLLIDTPKIDLIKALSRFAFQAETADLAIIYYAGHGMQLQGQNFLIPADAKIASNKDLIEASISQNDLLSVAGGARKMRIVILDSCRNNPFSDEVGLIQTGNGGGRSTRDVTADADASDTTTAPDTMAELRSIAGGLAPATPERGTILAFAAVDGQVASDGEGSNSPFAASLASKLTTPGLEIDLLFRQVRDDVMQMTNNQQEPYKYGSLSGTPFFLAGTDTAINDIDDAGNAWNAMRPDQKDEFFAIAKGGDTRALKAMGYIRMSSENVDADPTEAAAYFRKAADQGDPEAQYELARMYERGIGLPQDLELALFYYKASAESGFGDALNDMGFFYDNGMFGLPNDDALAVEYVARAAAAKQPQAMFNYAYMIDKSIVSGKSPDDAAELIYRSLRSGSEEVLKLLSEQPDLFSAPTRKALQAKLAQVSLYEGKIDGAFGPGTTRSIRKAYGLDD